jgi:hypothetical protein
MHGLVTADESRQQLYTMLTRGKIANHLYLQVFGDGDPHSGIWPETIRQSTPTDLLEQILARDDAARSATTHERELHNHAARLGEATRGYVDALHVAAEDLAGAQTVEALENAAEQAVPGLTDEPAWPTLRSRLLLLAASATDPVTQLLKTLDARELDSTDDQAACWAGDSTTPTTKTDSGHCPGYPPSPNASTNTRRGSLSHRPSSDNRRAGRPRQRQRRR